jgi:hypothetical protein
LILLRANFPSICGSSLTSGSGAVGGVTKVVGGKITGLQSLDFVIDATALSNGAGEEPIDNSSDVDASVSDCPAWSEESMIHWSYDRCERRLQKAVTRQDPHKTNQYLARQGILSDMPHRKPRAICSRF